MDCPKCATGGKPTKMYYDRIMTGGGSGLVRFSGNVNDKFNEVWRCWQCGTYKNVEVKPIEYGELLARENERIKEQLAKEKRDRSEQALNQRNISTEMAAMVLEKHKNVVADHVLLGTDWRVITKLLSASPGRKLSIATMQHVWEERYAA